MGFFSENRAFGWFLITGAGLLLAVTILGYAITVLIWVVIILASLLIYAPFRAWLLPAFRGEPFSSKPFATTPQFALSAIGAVPAAGLTLGVSHALVPAVVAAVVGAVGVRPAIVALDGRRLPLRGRDPAEFTTRTPGEFGLWIGEGTGLLAGMGHGAGIARGSNITLNARDAAKGVVVLGETGTGKTTRMLNHLLIQALDFDAGAFIFDLRGDCGDTVERLARAAGKSVRRIGIGKNSQGVNLLEGLTPNTAAGFLESAFKLLGQDGGDAGFWTGLAVSRAQAALAVLEHVPGKYSLAGLYSYVFDATALKAGLALAEEALLMLELRAIDSGEQADDVIARRLKAALDYERLIVPDYSEKEKSGLNRTLETALARFADPELQDAFCSASGQQAQLGDVLDGVVFVINVPREQFKAAAKVVYMFIKERFFSFLTPALQWLPEREKTDQYCSYAMSISKS